MKSPLTGTEMAVKYIVKGTEYYSDETGSLFSGCLDQSNMVGGTGNREENHGFRADILGNKKILDYGCGRGDFVRYLQNKGVDAHGFDPFSDDFKTLKDGETYDVVTMIEVIEHTCHPYAEIDHIRGILKPGGLLFIETSFSNWVAPGHPYLNPEIGHSTIFSHYGLDYLLYQRGYQPENHINQNIRIFKKSC